MVCQEMVKLAVRTKQDVVVNYLCQLVYVTRYPGIEMSFTRLAMGD